MKNNTKITLALAVIGTAVIVSCAVQRMKTRRMVAKISDEGYETAHDILYPDRSLTGKKLHFGPVLPD
jgi:hypothetical protein